MQHKNLLFTLLSMSLVTSCTNVVPPESLPEPVISSMPVTEKTISKEEYRNKTLGGLLGQISGFLSGYEFVWDGEGGARVGLPFAWYEFLNGPYAGNFEYFVASNEYRYDRLKVNPETGRNEIWGDDDYHIDIFNQLTMKEYGYTAKDIKDSWRDYLVHDWGGGAEAIRLINAHEMLSPYTGSIESGNKFGWCTEAYIENETLGMNAGGMPNVAVNLTDTFASNTGYFDTVIWAKFYAAMYSLAYFENDIYEILEQAGKLLPEGSGPKIMYDAAYKAYELYPNANDQYEFIQGAEYVESKGRNLYRMDNVQTNPGINGGFGVLSWLYAGNDYMDAIKYSSLMGYDGDCTAATVGGLMGILNGFKPSNEEYEPINNTLYYDGLGVYYNDKLTGFDPYIGSDEYPDRQYIDDIVDMYVENFETILLDNGGRIEGDNYIVPTTEIKPTISYLFDNYDAELKKGYEWTTEGWTVNNAELTNIQEIDLIRVHSGIAGFLLTNNDHGEAYHTYNNLELGQYYRVSTYVRTETNTNVSLFARGGGYNQEITFSNTTSLLNKDFVFRATSTSMDVGFKFVEGTLEYDEIYFDDFMLEKIDYLSYFKEARPLEKYNNYFLKYLEKPTNVKEGQEVYIRVQYTGYRNENSVVYVKRNNELYGSVVVNMTTNGLYDGYDYIEIPYVFGSDEDILRLEFEGNTLSFGDIEIIRKDQYIFR